MEYNIVWNDIWEDIWEDIWQDRYPISYYSVADIEVTAGINTVIIADGNINRNISDSAIINRTVLSVGEL